MKYLGYGFTLLLGLALGVGVMLAVMNPPSTIRVDVHNSSGLSVSQVTITHEEGTVSIRTLASGTTLAVPVLVRGESSYHIEARLASGDVVKGQSGFVEPGYQLRETITSTGIEHENISFY